MNEMLIKVVVYALDPLRHLVQVLLAMESLRAGQICFSLTYELEEVA